MEFVRLLHIVRKVLSSRLPLVVTSRIGSKCYQRIFKRLTEKLLFGAGSCRAIRFKPNLSIVFGGACALVTSAYSRDMAAHFEVFVSKEDFKFNCAHFISFKGFRERLHGHNYRISIKV